MEGDYNEDILDTRDSEFLAAPQSEGHEHVAKNVWDQRREGRPKKSSPSLCEQSELQCFAAK